MDSLSTLGLSITFGGVIGVIFSVLSLHFKRESPAGSFDRRQYDVAPTWIRIYIAAITIGLALALAGFLT